MSFAVDPGAERSARAARHVIWQRDGTSATVKLLDRILLDPATLREVQAELWESLASVQAGQLLLDMAAVKYCSKEAINILVQLRRELLDQGGRLKIFGASEQLQSTLRTLNLAGTVLAVYPTLEAALDSRP